MIIGKPIGFFEFLTMTTVGHKVVKGAVQLYPDTPLMKVARMAGGAALMAGASVAGKLISDLSHT